MSWGWDDVYQQNDGKPYISANAVDWSEAADPLIISEGYSQRDNFPLPAQDVDTPFIDSGDSEPTIFTEGYQQADFVPPDNRQQPDDIPYDWSETGDPDFIASSYGNSEPPPIESETWFDADLDEDLTWQWIDDNGYATIINVFGRQEGDDEGMHWFDIWTDTSADDDSGLDVIRADENPVGPNNLIPPTVLMPDIIGMPFEEGFTVCFAVGLNLQSPPATENVYYPMALVPAGIIVQQSPLPLQPVFVGSTVYAIVSSGLIVYPDSATVNSGNLPVINIADDTPV